MSSLPGNPQETLKYNPYLRNNCMKRNPYFQAEASEKDKTCFLQTLQMKVHCMFNIGWPVAVSSYLLHACSVVALLVVSESRLVPFHLCGLTSDNPKSVENWTLPLWSFNAILVWHPFMSIEPTPAVGLRVQKWCHLLANHCKVTCMASHSYNFYPPCLSTIISVPNMCHSVPNNGWNFKRHREKNNLTPHTFE